MESDCMDLKRNERFFKQNDVLRLLGGGLLIVGLIWFWIGRTAASYYGPCVMVPVGLILFLVTSARHVPESEIRGNIQKALANFHENAQGSPDMKSRVLSTPAPYCAESFVFDQEAHAFRRGKDAKLLSDVYQATAICFTQDLLLVHGATVDLSNGAVKTDMQKLLWTDLEGATMIPYENKINLTNKKNAVATARGAWLELQNSDGTIAYRAAVPDDMDGEVVCQQINKWIEKINKREIGLE